jgi:hypothetical protein
VRHGVPEVVQQQRGHIPAHAQPDQDALHRYVARGPGEGVGRYLPPARAQPVGQVEQGVAGVLAVSDPPGDRRDPGGGVAVTEQLERAELDDLRGKILADRVGSVVNAFVPPMAQAEEVVVLSNNLPGRPGEVDLEDRAAVKNSEPIKKVIASQRATTPSGRTWSAKVTKGPTLPAPSRSGTGIGVLSEWFIFPDGQPPQAARRLRHSGRPI